MTVNDSARNVSCGTSCRAGGAQGIQGALHESPCKHRRGSGPQGDLARRRVRGTCGLILPTDQLLNLSKPHAVAASGPLAPRIVRPSHTLATAVGHGDAGAGVSHPEPRPSPAAGPAAAGGGDAGAAANGAPPQPAPPPPASALRLLVRPLGGGL